MEKIERYKGSLLGLAAGDALGASVEFKKPGTFEPVEDMVGGGPWNLEPGQWTDDTSMALCLAESLIKCKGFNPVDQLERYLKWYREGYLSSTGYCFDTGITTRRAFEKFERTHESYCGTADKKYSGNGSLMRLASVPLFYAKNPKEAIEKAGDSSRTTHGADVCVDSCRYLAALIVGAVNGASKEELLSENYSPVQKYWEAHPFTPEVAEIASGSFKRREPPEIKGSGYVISTLEAALWAFYKSDSFKEGCLKVINLGDDADTTAAVYGQLAGAYYGKDAIPESWQKKLTLNEMISSFAEQLLSFS